MDVRVNGDEEVLGHDGGIYVPVARRGLNVACSPEQEAKYPGLWGGVKPDMSEELGPIDEVKLWDCPAGYFTVGVPMLWADREEVVHNLCIQNNELVHLGVFAGARQAGLPAG